MLPLVTEQRSFLDIPACSTLGVPSAGVHTNEAAIDAVVMSRSYRKTRPSRVMNAGLVSATAAKHRFYTVEHVFICTIEHVATCTSSDGAR